MGTLLGGVFCGNKSETTSVPIDKNFPTTPSRRVYGFLSFMTKNRNFINPTLLNLHMPGLQKIPKEDILGAIAKLGPCQPIDIRKELKQGDSFLIGAMLSELVAEGKLQISKVRRGGSPFY